MNRDAQNKCPYLLNHFSLNMGNEFKTGILDALNKSYKCKIKLNKHWRVKNNAKQIKKVPNNNPTLLCHIWVINPTLREKLAVWRKT
jgi:hypothetical protein